MALSQAFPGTIYG